MIVRTDQLTKDFLTGFWRPRPRRALDGVSFEVPAGEVVGLLGPNGAGKTTTLKLLMDLLRPTSGRAELFGRPAGEAAVRARVGYVPEQPYFYDHLTADELVRYFGALSGLTAADASRRAAAALTRTGIGLDDRRRPLRQFSKGMLQRVGLAQALVHDPELVILDEPMSGLDPVGRRDVRQLILALRDEGRTVLFSSHILSDAEQLCSRVVILRRGRVAAAGSLADLAARGSRGTEVIVAGVTPSALETLRPQAARVAALGDDRYEFDLAESARPEPFVTAVAASGARLVSVTPMRASLEDVFLDALGSNDAPNPPAPASGADR